MEPFCPNYLNDKHDILNWASTWPQNKEAWKLHQYLLFIIVIRVDKYIVKEHVQKLLKQTYWLSFVKECIESIFCCVLWRDLQHSIPIVQPEHNNIHRTSLLTATIDGFGRLDNTISVCIICTPRSRIYIRRVVFGKRESFFKRKSLKFRALISAFLEFNFQIYIFLSISISSVIFSFKILSQILQDFLSDFLHNSKFPLIRFVLNFAL